MKEIILILALGWIAVVPRGLHAASAFSLPSGARVEIVELPFAKNAFHVAGCTSSGGLCLINGQIPFGIAFGLPMTYVKSIRVSYRGESYSLDSSNMFNAWGDRPLMVERAIRYFGGGCVDVKHCEFRGIFSDGAGTFVAQWRIVDGREFRDVLTDSSDIIDLFMHNIDPPED